MCVWLDWATKYIAVDIIYSVVLVLRPSLRVGVNRKLRPSHDRQLTPCGWIVEETRWQISCAQQSSCTHWGDTTPPPFSSLTRPPEFRVFSSVQSTQWKPSTMMPRLTAQCKQQVNILEVVCLAVIPVTTQSLFKELVTEDHTVQYNDYITIHCVWVHTVNYHAASSLSMNCSEMRENLHLFVQVASCAFNKLWDYGREGLDSMSPTMSQVDQNRLSCWIHRRMLNYFLWPSNQWYRLGSILAQNLCYDWFFFFGWGCEQRAKHGVLRRRTVFFDQLPRWENRSENRIQLHWTWRLPQIIVHKSVQSLHSVLEALIHSNTKKRYKYV